MLGIKPSEAERMRIGDLELAALNGTHRRWMIGLAAAMVGLLGIGIAGDVLKSDADTGERSSAAVQAAAKKATPGNAAPGAAAPKRP
jgi:hypothetical protein